MADVLVRGMEMPKSCYGCNYQHWSNFWQRYVCCSVLREGDPIIINGKEVKSTDVLRSGRSDHCPIGELPPHGRLIDADALWVKIHNICNRRDAGIITDLTCIQQILSALRHAPTMEPITKRSKKIMTAKELAERLNGRQYGDEIIRAEAQLAKESGLVVVYGYSDDNMEFEGAIHDEFPCYDGGTAYIGKEKETYSLKDCQTDGARAIHALWCAPGMPAWSYETDIPHETFNIYEDDELFCIGIVFSLEDL